MKTNSCWVKAPDHFSSFQGLTVGRLGLGCLPGGREIQVASRALVKDAFTAWLQSVTDISFTPQLSPCSLAQTQAPGTEPNFQALGMELFVKLRGTTSVP